MIIPQDKVDKAAYDNTESLMYSHNSMETSSTAKRLDNSFKAGVKFAESELEGLSIKFGRWLLKHAREEYDSSGCISWYYNNPNDENTLYTTQEIFNIFLENEK